MNNKELYNKYFKENSDGSVTFLGQKLVILIPEDYLGKIADIVNTNVVTMGIFEGYIFDNVEEEDLEKADHVYMLKCPCEIILTPSSIDEFFVTTEDEITETMTREKVYRLSFYQGDNYIVSTSVVKSLQVVKGFFMLMFSGRLPTSLDYEDILRMWDQCNRLNGYGSFNSNLTSLASTVANSVRCPDDLSVPFRFRYEKYYAKGIRNGKLLRTYDIPKFTDVYSAMTSADPKYGLVVSMNAAEAGKGQINPTELLIE